MAHLSLRAPLAALCAGVVLAAAAPAASALGTIDQQQPAQDAAITMPPGIAQTFTVGRPRRLDGLTLTATTTGVVVYQLYDLRPDGTPDVSRPRLPANGSAALLAGVPADIAISPVSVAAGDRLALALGTVRSRATMSLATGTGDRYPAGDLFTVSGAFSFTAVPGVDLAFATHVTSPAPTQLVMRTLRTTSGRPTAVLTTGDVPAPLPGATVTFALRRADSTTKTTCTATTDATGTAACAGVKWALPKGGSATAAYAGDADHLPSSATVTS
jgi:hypothetical protein